MRAMLKFATKHFSLDALALQYSLYGKKQVKLSDVHSLHSNKFNADLSLRFFLERDWTAFVTPVLVLLLTTGPTLCMELLLRHFSCI